MEQVTRFFSRKSELTVPEICILGFWLKGMVQLSERDSRVNRDSGRFWVRLNPGPRLTFRTTRAGRPAQHPASVCVRGSREARLSNVRIVQARRPNRRTGRPPHPKHAV